MKFLNYVVYEYILIKRVTEKVERMLTAVNVNKVFIQFLMLVLSCFIEAARTLLLNKKRNKIISFFFFIFSSNENNNINKNINETFLNLLMIKSLSYNQFITSTIFTIFNNN